MIEEYVQEVKPSTSIIPLLMAGCFVCGCLVFYWISIPFSFFKSTIKDWLKK